MNFKYNFKLEYPKENNSKQKNNNNNILRKIDKPKNETNIANINIDMG